jgi:hypothetical protein
MSLPARILALLLALLVAFCFGWGMAVRKAARDALQEQLASERGARVLEAQEARRAARNSDALTQDRLRSERAAADVAGRLRQLAASAPDPAPGCPGRADDPRPAAWVLPDGTRADLVALANTCEAVSDRLRGFQRGVSDHAPVTHEGDDHL